MPDENVLEATQPAPEPESEQGAGIAEPEADARPETEESQSGEGEGTSSLAQFLAELSPEEFDRILSQRPELAQNSAYLRERERRAEQRGLTKARERIERVQRRDAAYDDILQQAQASEAYLSQVGEEVQSLTRRAQRLFEEGETEEAQKLLRRAEELTSSQDYVAAMEMVRLGDRILGSRQAMADIAEVIARRRDLLGELSEEEQEQLLQAMNEDAIRGTQKGYAYVLDLLVERARKAGIEEGKKLGRKEAEADLRLLERAERTLRVRDQAPPLVSTRTGRAVDGRERLLREMQEIDITTPEGLREWQRREAEFHRAIREE